MARKVPIKIFEQHPNEELEKLKLLAEIKSLNKKFYENPAFWTLLIAVSATVVTLKSGVFETNERIIKAETLELTQQRKLLRVSVDSLKNIQQKLKHNSDSAFKALINIKLKLNNLNNEKRLERDSILKAGAISIKKLSENSALKQNLLNVISSINLIKQEYYTALNMNESIELSAKSNIKDDKKLDSVEDVFVKNDDRISREYAKKMKPKITLAIECRKKSLEMHPELSKFHPFTYSSTDCNVDVVSKVSSDLTSIFNSIK